MDLEIKDKVFIVSGGSKGIGEGITLAIVEEGAIPVIATRSNEATTKLSEELSNGSREHHCVIGDLRDTKNCKNVIDETVEKFGRIDGIVNNAGVNDGASLEAGPEAFRKSIDLNLFHYYDLVHFGLPYLKKSKGSILNIASKVAITGQGGTSGYAAAKGAQLAMTREWAVELLKYNIRVNAILPAEVMTPLYQNWLNTFEDPRKKLEEIQQNIPLGNRMTTSGEIASMAVYLLSARASHITGQHLYVDGGYAHLDRSLNT
jgi:L-fucose dehydrogenase